MESLGRRVSQQDDQRELGRTRSRRSPTPVPVGEWFRTASDEPSTVPINPALLAHLQSLSKGAIVTVSGIGHGDGRYNIHIYPVHRVNGYEP